MSLDQKARVTVGVEGADAGKREFEKLGEAGKKAGADIDSAFRSVGQSVTSFAAKLVDAAVGFRGLDPKEMVASFFAYERQVARTGVAVGQTVDSLRVKYADLARQNAVMPQSIDTFAKSLGRMTYDIKGSIDAFSGLRDAALAVGDTEQDWIPFAAQLKNIYGISGDTTASIGKLFAQAEKLGTVGGPRALRDLLVNIGPAIDSTISRFGQARSEAKAFAATLTAGMPASMASRVAGSALQFLQNDAIGMMRTLHYNPYDEEGHIKKPLKVMTQLDELAMRPVSEGGRGFDEKRLYEAYINDYGIETGSILYNRARRGRMNGKVREIANLGPSSTASNAGAAYRFSRAGRADMKDVAYFLAGQDVVNPLGDMLTNINDLVAKHPLLASVASSAIQAGLGRAAPMVGKLLKQAANSGIPAVAAMAAVGAAGYEDIESQRKDYEQARADEKQTQDNAAAFGLDTKTYRRFRKELGEVDEKTKTIIQSLAAKELAAELRNGPPLPVEVRHTPAHSVESNKNPKARN